MGNYFFIVEIRQRTPQLLYLPAKFTLFIKSSSTKQWNQSNNTKRFSFMNCLVSLAVFVLVKQPTCMHRQFVIFYEWRKSWQVCANFGSEMCKHTLSQPSEAAAIIWLRIYLVRLVNDAADGRDNQSLRVPELALNFKIWIFSENFPFATIFFVFISRSSATRIAFFWGLRMFTRFIHVTKLFCDKTKTNRAREASDKINVMITHDVQTRGCH